jgi:hypothetical protein
LANAATRSVSTCRCERANSIAESARTCGGGAQVRQPHVLHAACPLPAAHAPTTCLHSAPRPQPAEGRMRRTTWQPWRERAALPPGDTSGDESRECRQPAQHPAEGKGQCAGVSRCARARRTRPRQQRACPPSTSQAASRQRARSSGTSSPSASRRRKTCREANGRAEYESSRLTQPAASRFGVQHAPPRYPRPPRSQSGVPRVPSRRMWRPAAAAPLRGWAWLHP